MPHASVPTATDLAAYLTGSGLFPSVPVTSAGTATVTHTVAGTSRMRVGDQLYFGVAVVLRTVTAIPTGTTVTVSGATFNTVVGERVTIFPQSLDLATMIGAGIERFEDETGRKFAPVTQTRYFDLPTGPHGMLDLQADLVAITSVTVGNTALVLNTDYRPLSEDADEEGLPWTRIQLGRPYGPYSYWSAARKVAVAGSWGYSSTVPDGAWSGMLVAAVLFGLPQLSAARSRGVVSWGEADVNENYGKAAFEGLSAMWAEQFKNLAHLYDRKTVG